MGFRKQPEQISRGKSGMNEGRIEIRPERIAGFSPKDAWMYRKAEGRLILAVILGVQGPSFGRSVAQLRPFLIRSLPIPASSAKIKPPTSTGSHTAERLDQGLALLAETEAVIQKQIREYGESYTATKA